MQEGSFRCDANVSVRRKGDPKLGTRAEIKNVNSFRFVEKAIEYEIYRQIDVLESGEKVRQETRLWDPNKAETRSMRSKEEAHDYRYFPDPDLLPLVITQEYVDEIKRTMPELPDQKKERYMAMGLSAYDASVIVAEKETTDYFEALAKGRDAKLASNWMTGELFGRLNKAGTPFEESPITAAKLGALF